MSGPLTRSVVRGATWTGIAQVSGQGFRLISMVVLARLLVPDDFGVVAIAMIFTSLVSQTVDLGFNQAIVQRKEVTPSHLSTTFWISWGMGIIFCLATVGASPLISSFFSEDSVGPVLAVLSISFVITPLGSVHGALLRRGLKFFQFSMAEISGSVTYLVVAVSLAFAGFGVWSLVFGSLASDATYVTLRWILCRWHPSFTFSRQSLKELWGFGMKITGIKILGALSMRLDYVIIGRFLTPAAVGFYNLACKVPSYPINGLDLVVMRVAFPAYSSIQDEGERLRRGYAKSVSFVSLIGLPMLIGLAIVTPEVVRVFFGEQWIPAIVPMQILCLGAGRQTLSAANSSVFWSKGRPDIELKLNIIGFVIDVPALLLGVQFGATGVALACMTIGFFWFPIKQTIANRLLGLRLRDYLAVIRPAVFGTAVMAVVVLGFRYGVGYFTNLPDAAMLAILVPLGALTYFIVLKVTRVEPLDEMVGLILEMARSYKSLFMEKIASFRRPASPGVGAANDGNR
jgi:O-antigen/teichoic acid export membrane protein